MARNNPKPTDKLDWIPDDTTNILEPLPSVKATGWLFGQKPPNTSFNFITNLTNRLTDYFAAQVQDWIVIDSDADEGDYATLAAYIADTPAAADRILVKEDQTVTAQVVLPDDITIKFLDGARLLCATNIATSVLKLGSNPIIEGVLNIVLSHTGTTAKAVEIDGDNATGKINVENSSTGTLTTGYHINANKTGNQLTGFVDNTGGGVLTNEFIDNSTEDSNDIVIREGVGNTVIRSGPINIVGALRTAQSENWFEQSNPKNFTLRDVTNGNSLFVAIGDADGTDAYIVTSINGIAWTERSNPKNVDLQGITWGNSLFVAVGSLDGTDAYIVTSPDGIAWTERSNPKNFSLIDVTWGNSLFVAVGTADGSDAYIITSPDGITWTERSNPKNVDLQGVTWGNSLFVAVGTDDGSDAYIITSPDGITWTERSNPKSFGLERITHNGSLFVVVGDADGSDAYIITSPDGITWTERSNPKNVNLDCIVWSGDLFLSAGLLDSGQTYLITSPDGITWTQRNNGSIQNIFGVAYGSSVFVGVGSLDGTDANIQKSLAIGSV